MHTFVTHLLCYYVKILIVDKTHAHTQVANIGFYLCTITHTQSRHSVTVHEHNCRSLFVAASGLRLVLGKFFL